MMPISFKYKNPRLSNLTLKVIGVNILTLLILLFGVLYLGQYRTRIVIEKLERFTSEVELIAMGLSTSGEQYNRRLMQSYARATNNNITAFDHDGQIIEDITVPQNLRSKRVLQSVEILKAVAGVISFQRNENAFSIFPTGTYPGLNQAMDGDSNFAVWVDTNNQFVLSAAAPIVNDNGPSGAIFVMRNAHDIENELNRIWKNIMIIFMGASIVTLILSIYFASTIAKPLRQLSRAAEKVRTTKPYSAKIPNLSYRYDEIGDLSRSLQLMTNALWSRMHAIDSFAADVAHELKNPLTSLKSAVETLPKVKKKKDQATLLSIIIKDVERMDRLITDIAKSSRLDATLGTQAQTKINLYTFLSDILKSYHDHESLDEYNDQCDTVVAAGKKILCLNANKKDKLITIFSTADQLKQVITNIIDNALSFTPDHGQIDINLLFSKKQVVISILDQGVGIPEEKLDMIFQRFYTDRTDQSVDSLHSGLGLSICKQIVTAMHGEIYARIRNDRTGAEFVITLPA